MNLGEFERIVKDRRSIRKWKRNPIPDEVLRKAVELATWAPNGGNHQNWYFIVVKQTDMIVKMADTVQSVVDKMAEWPECADFQEDIDRSQKNASFFRNAAACVAVFVGQYQSGLDKVLAPRECIDDEARHIKECRGFAPTSIQSAAAAIPTRCRCTVWGLEPSGWGRRWSQRMKSKRFYLRPKTWILFALLRWDIQMKRLLRIAGHWMKF
ncbi:MAG: nitroreductase family protein [Deltaproteobacteria bacterium]|nr:nitroreductase family protein [Deltaproteobacteria bacterium]